MFQPGAKAVRCLTLHKKVAPPVLALAEALLALCQSKHRRHLRDDGLTWALDLPLHLKSWQ